MVDAEGMEALTMRRLAEDLGVATTAIYWHVRTRDELLRGILDRAINQIQIPDRDGPWEERLRIVCRETRQTMLTHPHLSELARRFASDVPARVLQATIEIMQDAGFDGAGAVEAAVMAHLFASGFTTAQAQDPHLRAASFSPGSGFLADWLQIAGPEGPFLLGHFLALDHDAIFERALEHLIDGLRSDVQATKQVRPLTIRRRR
jgi:AcrR family transcriptional regulator